VLSISDAAYAQSTEPANNVQNATAWSTDINGLPAAQATQTVELKDGDEFTITAGYVQKQVGNRSLRMLAYNGSIPGPFIKAAQGATISIHFNNATDLDLTLHSHGVRVDNLSDGVPGITQDSVKPGASYTYKIKFLDAGVYWYHPHTREDYAQELGLYGNYLITPSVASYWNPIDREIPLIVDDILIENEQIASFWHEYTNYALLGRFGNEYLVNGETGYKLNVRQGERIRFFVTNVSNARTYNLAISNTPVKLVAADIGRFEHEQHADNFLISPAERVVMETCFDQPGHYMLQHTMPGQQIQLVDFSVSADNGNPCGVDFKKPHDNAEVIKEFAGFRNLLATAPDKRLLLTISLAGQKIDHSQHIHASGQSPVAVAASMPDHASMNHDPKTTQGTDSPAVAGKDLLAEQLKKIQWDDPQHSDRLRKTPEIYWKLIDEQTGKENQLIDDWVFKQGQLVKIRLTNNPKADHVMQHPVHLHGQQFVVLSTDGVPSTNLAWKDTMLLLPGQSVDLLVQMNNPEVWMLHCHISEHLQAGMSLNFRVEDKNGYAKGDDYRAGAPHTHH